MKAQDFFSANFSFHDAYEQFAKFFARQIFPLYGTLVARDQSTHQINAEYKDQYPMSHLFSDDDEIVNNAQVQDHGSQSWRATVVIQAFPAEGIVDSGDGIWRPFQEGHCCCPPQEEEES